MKTYSKFSPTGFDRSGAFLPDRQNWLVLPVSQNRDSGPLDESNFASALELLGGESDDCEAHRFGHWGPGWFEIIIVNPENRELVRIAEEIESALSDYPVLDEHDYSAREHECFLESWDSWGRRDFTHALSKKLLADFSNGVSHEWTDGEITDAIEELETEAIDALREQAARSVNWEYQAESSGVCINISGLVDCVDTDRLANLCIDYLQSELHRKEVEKLAGHLGASPQQARECSRAGFETVPAIRALLNSTP
jgi:hypothetical protein